MVTLKANYTETLNADTVKIVDELTEYQYDLENVLDFIDTWGEQNIKYCEEYLDLVNSLHGYGDEVEIIDDYINNALGCISYVGSIDADSYLGQFDDIEDFIRDYELVDQNIPECLVIDWSATWEANIRYDYYRSEDGHIWRSY
jgi:hypothetical protein|tara:strand:- start:449 stop:880 length:432 start_codon:yes stop_codon:yes gene_type:complete